MNSKRPVGPVVKPSPTLPAEVAALVEELVEENEKFSGAEAWARYEQAKHAISQCCGPLAGERGKHHIFQRALHAYMMGVCI